MLSNLSVTLASQDRLLVYAAGMNIITECVHRDTDGPSTSSVVITFSGVQISGLVNDLYYSIYNANTWATDSVHFTAVPSGLDTVTIAGITYTFVNTLSGLNQVPLQPKAGQNAVALYRTVNANGISGTDFYSGQTANPYVSGLYPDNPLIFRATVSGVMGNSLTISTTSSSITVGSASFVGGQSSAPSPLYTGSILTGGYYLDSYGNKILTEDGQYITFPLPINGTAYILQDVPYSDMGEAYLVNTWFTNSSGIQALDTSGNLSSYWTYSPFFTGRTALPYYAEVSGLIAYNLYGGHIPSDGQVGLVWPNVLKYFARSGQQVKFAYPDTAGVQVQASGLYSYESQGEKVDYVIFVFQSSGSAPQEPWPRPVDANGTWYHAGKTNKTAITLNLPAESTSTYSIWVGFGNKDTRITSGLPFNSVLPTIFLN